MDKDLNKEAISQYNESNLFSNCVFESVESGCPIDSLFVDYENYIKKHRSEVLQIDIEKLTPEYLSSLPNMGWIQGTKPKLETPPVKQDAIGLFCRSSLKEEKEKIDIFLDQLKTKATYFRHVNFPSILPEDYEELVCAIDCETESLDTRVIYDYSGNIQRPNKICGLSVAVDEVEGFYFPFFHIEEPELGIFNWSHEASLYLLDRLNAEFALVLHNSQFDREMFAIHGCSTMRPFPYFFDTMLISFLADVNSKSHGLKKLSSSILNQQMVTMGDIFNTSKGILFNLIPARAAYVYGALDSVQTFGILKHFVNLPQENNPFYTQPVPFAIDHKFTDVLRQIYRVGLPINLDYAIFAARDTIHRLKQLKEAIHAFCGRPVAFTSSVVLAKLLFEEFKIPILAGEQPNVSGYYSVKEEVLEELHAKYPQYKILEYIVTYRKLQSNLSKLFYKAISYSYVDSFIPFLRSKPSFSQTTVPTGRLASNSSGSRARVVVKKTNSGRYTQKYDNKGFDCGFNTQGISVLDTRSVKVKQILKNSVFSEDFLRHPYDSEEDLAFYEGLQSI